MKTYTRQKTLHYGIHKSKPIHSPHNQQICIELLPSRIKHNLSQIGVLFHGDGENLIC